MLAEKGTRSTKNAFLFIQLNQSKSKRRSCIRGNKINPIDYFLWRYFEHRILNPILNEPMVKL